MFIVIFFKLAFSIFIPYNITTTSTLPKITIEEVNKIDKSTIAVAFGDSYDLDGPHDFDLLQSIFSGQDIRFFHLSYYDAAKLAESKKIELPAFFVFKKTDLIAAIHAFGGENELLHQIDFLLNGIPYISSPKEFYQRIGDGSYTILTSTSKKSLAEETYERMKSKINGLDILAMSDSLFAQLELNPRTLHLYRRHDDEIITFDNLTDEFIIKSTIAVFGEISDKDRNLDQFFIVFNNISLTYQNRTILHRISTDHPEYRVGFLPKPYSNLAEKTTGYKSIFYFINFKRRIWYNTQHIFDDLHFDINNWIDAINVFLGKVKQNQLEVEIKSEPIPNDQENLLEVKKVVGKTYQSFINDENHDVLIYYFPGFSDFEQTIYKKFADFAEECSENRVDFLSFGKINTNLNSVQCGYPYFRALPHIRLFPAKNKSNHQPTRNQVSRDSLIRLVYQYATMGKLPFEVVPPNENEVGYEKAIFDTYKRFVPKDEQIKFDEYLSTYKAVFNITEKSNQKIMKDEL